MRSFRWRWPLDEVVVRLNGVPHDLWRAVDHESEVQDVFVSKTLDKAAAQNYGASPSAMTAWVA